MMRMDGGLVRSGGLEKRIFASCVLPMENVFLVMVWEEVRAGAGSWGALRGAHFVGKEVWTLGSCVKTGCRMDYFFPSRKINENLGQENSGLGRS